MVLLESEQFLTELTRLFQKCRTSGSVYITLKKYDGRTKPVPRKTHVESSEQTDNKCLLRATDGKKKISTVNCFFEDGMVIVGVGLFEEAVKAASSLKDVKTVSAASRPHTLDDGTQYKLDGCLPFLQF